MTRCPHSLHRILSVVFMAVRAPQSVHVSVSDRWSEPLCTPKRAVRQPDFQLTSTDVLYRLGRFGRLPTRHRVGVLLRVRVVALRHGGWRRYDGCRRETRRLVNQQRRSGGRKLTLRLNGLITSSVRQTSWSVNSPGEQRRIPLNPRAQSLPGLPGYRYAMIVPSFMSSSLFTNSDLSS